MRVIARQMQSLQKETQSAVLVFTANCLHELLKYCLHELLKYNVSEETCLLLVHCFDLI